MFALVGNRFHNVSFFSGQDNLLTKGLCLLALPAFYFIAIALILKSLYFMELHLVIFSLLLTFSRHELFKNFSWLTSYKYSLIVKIDKILFFSFPLTTLFFGIGQ